jgi:methanogenic corrinoid protein MtbC1
VNNTETETGARVDPESVAFLDAILRGDRRTALEVARRLLDRGIPYLYEQVVQPALVEVGALWYANRLTVADEHLATATAQSAIASLYPDVPWPARGANAPRSVVACVEGDRHAIGARMVADLLALDGWAELFLGADTPLDALVSKVAAIQPALVGLSITLPHLVPCASEGIERLKDRVPGVRVIVGGRALARLAEPLRALPADAWARSATGAVDAARSWKPV